MTNRVRWTIAGIAVLAIGGAGRWTLEDICAAISYAANLTREEEILPLR